jgi:uncharacterized RDD family membrane protein YckC
MFTDRIETTTPERVVVGYDVAGVGSRLLAQAIDLGVLSAILIGIFWAMGALTIVLPDAVALTVAIVLFAVLPFAYFLVPEARRGATIGKRALGIRIVTEDGAPIGWRESTIRNLLRLIDFLPSLYLLGGIVAIVSARGQRLGDMAAGTVAVRVHAEHEGRFAGSGGTFVETASAMHEGRVPPELVALLVRYRRRWAEFTPDTRAELAESLAIRLEPYHPRPEGMSTEEFVVRAAVTYAGDR